MAGAGEGRGRVGKGNTMKGECSAGYYYGWLQREVHCLVAMRGVNRGCEGTCEEPRITSFRLRILVQMWHMVQMRSIMQMISTGLTMLNGCGNRNLILDCFSGREGGVNHVR